jgi:hypothetical protein
VPFCFLQHGNKDRLAHTRMQVAMRQARLLVYKTCTNLVLLLDCVDGSTLWMESTVWLNDNERKGRCEDFRIERLL